MHTLPLTAFEVPNTRHELERNVETTRAFKLLAKAEVAMLEQHSATS